MKTVSLYTIKQEDLQTVLSGLTEELLESNKFVPCGKYDSRRIGFSHNLDKTYVSAHREGILLRLTDQCKVPESNRVNDMIKERTEVYTADTDTKPSKKMLTDWKIEITEELLPETYPKAEKHYLILIRKDGTVLIEGNHKKAEDLCDMVRKALGSFPIVPFETDKPCGDLLDDLVKAGSDDYLELLDKATLVTAEGHTVAISKESVYNSDAKEKVEDGGMMTSCSILYDGLCSFGLKDDLTFNGVKYDEQLSGDKEDENPEDTSQLLQLTEICKVVDEVVKRLTEEK